MIIGAIIETVFVHILFPMLLGLLDILLVPVIFLINLFKRQKQRLQYFIFLKWYWKTINIKD